MPDSLMDSFVQRLIASKGRGEPWGPPGTTIPEGSPQLDEPLRSRHEAALQIAVNRLRAIEARAGGPSYHAMTDVAEEARRALRCIADLVPEAVP